MPVRAIGESGHGVGRDVASEHFTRRPARGLDDRVIERYRAGRSPRQLRDPLSGNLKVGILTPQPFEKTFDVALQSLECHARDRSYIDTELCGARVHTEEDATLQRHTQVHRRLTG